jgi:NADH-quinone oxidoreductase subunit H
MVVRWTIPRFRFDQLMSLAWKVMIPLSILHLFAAMCVRQFGWPLWVLTLLSVSLFVLAGLWGGIAGLSVTPPRRRVAKLPVGLPAGVTYASR